MGRYRVDYSLIKLKDFKHYPLKRTKKKCPLKVYFKDFFLLKNIE